MYIIYSTKEVKTKYMYLGLVYSKSIFYVLVHVHACSMRQDIKFQWMYMYLYMYWYMNVYIPR